MTPNEMTNILHLALLKKMTEICEALGKKAEDLAVEEGVDYEHLLDFIHQRQLHLPTVVAVFRALGFSLDLTLTGYPAITFHPLAPAEAKKYFVTLTGLARMKQFQEVHADSEEAAIEAAFLQSGDRVWKYQGMVDDTLEGDAALKEN